MVFNTVHYSLLLELYLLLPYCTFYFLVFLWLVWLLFLNCLCWLLLPHPNLNSAVPQSLAQDCPLACCTPFLVPSFNIIADTIGRADFTCSMILSLESCWWLNDSCYRIINIYHLFASLHPQLFSLLFPLLLLGPSWQYQLHHCCFYTCFWTSGAWNKDTVLLDSILYCTVKHTEAQPLAEDAH